MNVYQPIKIGGGKLTQNPERLKSWLAGENPGPLTVNVGLTHGCNHNCVHCACQLFNPYEGRKSFIDTALFKQFMKDCQQMGVAELFFAGSGEPLLHPDLEEILQYGHALGLNLTVSTNGMLLTPKRAETILPFLNWVRVSVNGGDSSTYADVHDCHERDFEQLVTRLGHAAKIRDEQQLRVKIGLQFLVHDLNRHSIPAMAAFHRRVRSDVLIFRNTVDENGQFSRVSPEELELLRQAEKQPGIEVRWENFGEAELPAAWSQCHGINFRTNLDYDGNLFTCQRQFYKESRYGNIKEQRLPEIWQSQRRLKIFAEVGEGADRHRCHKWCQSSFDNLFLEGHCCGDD